MSHNQHKLNSSNNKPSVFSVLKTTLLAASVSVLVACSGGGGGSEPTPKSDTKAPKVVSVSPDDGAKIAKKPTITVTFSESVKGVNTSNVSLTKSGSSDSADLTIAGSGKTYTIKPNADLEVGASYTLTLKKAIADIAGNKLAADEIKTYTVSTNPDPAPNPGGGGTTDTTAPTISSLSPANNATIGNARERRPTITVTFSETVKNVNDTNVKFKLGTTVVPVTISSSNSGKTYAIRPVSNLIHQKTAVKLEFKAGIKDTAGNALVAVTKNYTTGDFIPPEISSISPKAGEVLGSGSDKRPTIRVTFSENVKNFNTNTLVLKKAGTTQEAVTISGSGKTYEIKPDANLAENVAYRLEFSASITDEAGNAFAPIFTNYAAYSDTVAPTATFEPANGNIGSASIKRPPISINFSEAVSNVNAANVTLTKKGTNDTVRLSITANSSASKPYAYRVVPQAKLAPGVTYTLALKDGIVDKAASPNKLVAINRDFKMYGTLDTTAPTLSITPSHTSTGVARDTDITLTFSEEVTGVNTTNIKLSTSRIGSPPAPISLENKGNNTYRIKSDNNLGGTTTITYYVVITPNSIKDISGNAYVPPAAADTHRFVTSPRTLPVTGADIEAWVGSSNTSLKTTTTLPKLNSKHPELHGFSNADCSLLRPGTCSHYSMQENLAPNVVKTYTASILARTGYYRLKHGVDESKTAAISGQVFSGRSHHQTVVHDGKFWVIGGYKVSYVGVSEKATNDVWSSADGINWTKVLPNNLNPSSTQFVARYSHSALSYNGRLWVIGGRSITGSNINDVWSSADGKTWRRELNTDTSTTSTTQFSARYAQQALVHKNKMYVFGGTGANYLGDAWSSTDGKTWTKVSTAFPRVGYPKVVSHNNVLWLVGGYQNNSIHKSTDDGVTWTQVLPSSLYAPHVLTGQYPARFGQQVAVLNNKIWVTGGHCKRVTNCGGQRLNGKLHYDTWVANINSNNSLSYFTRVSVNNGKSYHRRYFHTMTVRDNKLWIIGGAGNVRLNDVWSSTNGTEWTAADTNASLTHYRHQIAHFKGRFWSFGGFNGTFTRELKMHSSTNGIDWSEETLTGTKPIVGDGHQMLAFDNKLWIIGGRDANGAKSNKVYSSADGKAWTDVTDATQGAAASYTGFSARYAHQAVASGTSMYVIGGEDSTGYLGDVWKLDAGTNKKWTKLGSSHPKRGFHQAVDFDGKIWIIGGKGTTPSNATVLRKDVFTTTSMGGMNTEADFDTRGRFDHQAAVLGNKLYVIAGRQADATSGYVNDVRSLTQGATSWVQETASAPFSKRVGHQLVSDGTHLYLFGGYDDLKAIPKDVWRSSDGVNWSKGTKVKIEVP